MPYAKIPKDLNKIKTTLVFNLTARQIVYFSLGAVAGILAYFLARGFFSSSGACLALLIAALPFFVFALYEKNGQPLEKVIKNYVNFKFVRPPVRPYSTDNIYSVIQKQGKMKREVNENARKRK